MFHALGTCTGAGVGAMALDRPDHKALVQLGETDKHNVCAKECH